jgi:hypothetical protein
MAVGFVQRVGDLRGYVERRRRFERSFGEPRGQELAADVLHDDEGGAFVLADVVGHRDAGRAQRRGGARFVEEPAPALGIGRERRRQELERDLPAQPGVLGQVDFAHPAAAEPFADPVMRHDLTGHSRNHILY